MNKHSIYLSKILIIVLIILTFTGCSASTLNNPKNSANMIENYKEAVNKLSNGVLDKENNSEIQEYLASYKENSEFNIVYSYVALETGDFLVYPHIDLPENFKPQERPWYKEAEQNGYYVSELYQDPGTGKKIITITKKIIKDGKTLGVAGIDFIMPENK